MSYWTILLRVGLSVLLGGVIGIERQSKHRPAGFRTHILVCLGSMTLMLLSEMVFMKYYSSYGVSLDPTRIGAQVVSGIGFLGAGTIIHYGTNVKGLTTAASLWAVAAIGLTVGAGFYELAITVSVVLYITLMVFNKVYKKLDRGSNTYEIVISLLNKPKTLGAINLLIAKNNGKILDMIFNTVELDDGSKNGDMISVTMTLQMDSAEAFEDTIQDIRGISGVLAVESI